MKTDHNRAIAVQRLTALWALSESGLGGLLHAFRMPFTGIFAGGMAIVLLTLIAHFASNPFKSIFKSLIVVLIIKAMVSPHSPFMAYFAVSVQAVLAAGIFRLFGIRFLAILLVSFLAMWESALQKLLMLTFFFGNSIWKALDEMVAFMAKQTGIEVSNGSIWIASIYLGIYSLAAIFIAGISYKLWFRINHGLLPIKDSNTIENAGNQEFHASKSKPKPWLWYLVLISLIAIVLFYVEKDDSSAWFRVGKTIVWSLASIIFWYGLVNPILLRFTQNYLKKKESQYVSEVNETLKLIPAFKSLAKKAWTETAHLNGFERMSTFVNLLVFWSLLWEE